MADVRRWIQIAAIIIAIAVPFFESFLRPQPANAAQGDGVMLYAAASNTTPQLQNYSAATNSFNANTNTVAGTQATIVQLKTSPTKDEIIAGYQNASGSLQIMCFNGSTWTNEWSVSVGGTGTTRRFDIAYETSTGDVTVLYSRNTAAVNAVAYRTKSGASSCGAANWAAATNAPTTTSTTTGIVQWVKAARDGRSGSSLDAFTWADANSDLGAAIWNGSAFTNFKALETSLEFVTAAQDVDNFELQYETLTGDLMVVWGNSAGANGTNGARYSTCNGGTASCTWLAATAIPSLLDDATNLDLSTDPTSDKMAFASIGNAGSDLQAAYWSGTAWSGYPNIDATCETPAAGMRKTQTGWVTNNGITKWFLTYDDASGTGLSWFATTPGTALTTTAGKQSDFATTPAINDIRERMMVDNNPFDNAQLLLFEVDAAKNIVAEQLTIDNSGNLTWTDVSGPSGLGTTQSIPAEGISFQYKRFAPPSILNVDIVDGSGASVASPNVALTTLISGASCQTATGTLGTATQKIRLVNNTANPAWTVSIAATGGATATWSSGTATYDYNDTTASGCSDGADSDGLAGGLSLTPDAASFTPTAPCTTTGLSLGSAASFNQGTVDAVTLGSAAASAGTGCTWDLTGIGLSQTIPAFTPAGTYNLALTITVVAN